VLLAELRRKGLPGLTGATTILDRDAEDDRLAHDMRDNIDLKAWRRIIGI
jgi:hypothetical protein